VRRDQKTNTVRAGRRATPIFPTIPESEPRRARSRKATISPCRAGTRWKATSRTTSTEAGASIRARRSARTSKPIRSEEADGRKKTHAQQIRIIEGRENTRNAGKEFDAEADLKQSEQEREAFRKGANLKTPPRDLADPDDRNLLRGEHQESRHHKNRPDD